MTLMWPVCVLNHYTPPLKTTPHDAVTHNPEDLGVHLFSCQCEQHILELASVPCHHLRLIVSNEQLLYCDMH